MAMLVIIMALLVRMGLSLLRNVRIIITEIAPLVKRFFRGS